jgi:hypothetical protein
MLPRRDLRGSTHVHEGVASNDVSHGLCVHPMTFSCSQPHSIDSSERALRSVV